MNQSSWKQTRELFHRAMALPPGDAPLPLRTRREVARPSRLASRRAWKQVPSTLVTRPTSDVIMPVVVVSVSPSFVIWVCRRPRRRRPAARGERAPW